MLTCVDAVEMTALSNPTLSTLPVLIQPKDVFSSEVDEVKADEVKADEAKEAEAKGAEATELQCAASSTILSLETRLTLPFPSALTVLLTAILAAAATVFAQRKALLFSPDLMK